MVSMNSVGLPALVALRRHSQLAIHGHRNGWGMLRPLARHRHELHRVSEILAAGRRRSHARQRAATTSSARTMQSVIASARECLTPMFDVPGRGCEIMPVFSSGQSARQAPDTYQALGSTDLIFACGGGIMAHPGGIAAGVAPPPGVGGGRRRRTAGGVRAHTPNSSRRSEIRRMSEPLFSYYGDDFTGSTDALEALAANGVPSVLFPGTSG